MSIEITQLSLTMHSPLGLDKERWYLLSLLCILKWDWTKKDGIHRDYSNVTPDAFSTEMGQRRMISIEITQFSLRMHSPLGLHKERWYLQRLFNCHSRCILHWDWTKKDDIYRDYSIVTPDAFSNGIGQRKMISIENTQLSLLKFSTGMGQIKMVSIEINSIVTPDAFSTGTAHRKMISIENTQLSLLKFSTGIGQRKMVSIKINSIVTPDAFSTGTAHRKMISIENTQLSLLMHSPLGWDKERWYL